MFLLSVRLEPRLFALQLYPQNSLGNKLSWQRQVFLPDLIDLVVDHQRQGIIAVFDNMGILDSPAALSGVGAVKVIFQIACGGRPLSEQPDEFMGTFLLVPQDIDTEVQPGQRPVLQELRQTYLSHVIREGLFK